jgi:TolA-binding protein
MRKALLIIGLAGLACGSQETSTSPDMGAAGGETPEVSAVQPPSEEAMPEEAAEPVEAVEAVEAVQAGDAVEVTTCVELVTSGKYAEAVVACQTAVSLYPDNAAAADALAKATAAHAASAGAGALGEAAKDAATQ